MKILLLNQTFHPDVMATSQYLTDLALALHARGHQVTVVAGRRAYDNPEREFPACEVWQGITIHRVTGTRLGKGAKWKRAVDFGTFILAGCVRLARLPRPDVIVALTSPPLISVLGAALAAWHRSRFVYWVMDFNPDEAIAAGWLRADSLAGRALDKMSRFSLRRADRIIALDRFMRERIVAKQIPADKIAVLPPWPQDDHVCFAAAGREEFRRRHGLTNKFVVMYSGNHSPVHPLDTLLAAAQQLADDPEFVFAFIGGGSEFKRIQALARERANLFCLPYQPLAELAASLSAADVQVVVMGNPFVGLVHPCKIYNILTVAAPVLYLGPESSHVVEILAQLPGHPRIIGRHGDVAGLVAQLRAAKTHWPREPARANITPPAFTRPALLPQFLEVVESSGAGPLSGAG